MGLQPAASHLQGKNQKVQVFFRLMLLRGRIQDLGWGGGGSIVQKTRITNKTDKHKSRNKPFKKNHSSTELLPSSSHANLPGLTVLLSHLINP
jgi:hypothetical protein